MSVEEVNVECWSCKTKFTTNYEISEETISQGIDTYGNAISIKTTNPRLFTIFISIKCPNPECGNKSVKSIDIPKYHKHLNF